MSFDCGIVIYGVYEYLRVGIESNSLINQDGHVLSLATRVRVRASRGGPRLTDGKGLALYAKLRRSERSRHWVTGFLFYAFDGAPIIHLTSSFSVYGKSGLRT